MESKTAALQTPRPVQVSGERAAIYAFMGLFALLLALVTSQHEIYVDEAQAWLIARDSGNLLELVRHLRYEGHPALWYLLIYLPAHLSANLEWMQVLNYVLSLAMAWLVLSERRLPLAMRVMSVFSVPLFFYMGVVARSYMLAAVLLVGAARCLLAGRPRHWPAMVLLALAVNAHVFAIPVAAGIFVWFYWLAPEPSLKVAAGRLRECRFWKSAAILGAALLVCYFTVRPAPDMRVPQYERAGLGTAGYLVLGIGRVWNYFLPFPLGVLSVPYRELIAPWEHPSLLAAALTIALWLLAVSVLAARRSRWFVLSVPVMWMVGVWATVHIPGPFHSSFLFVDYVIALLANMPREGERPWLPSRYARPLLFLLLAMQIPISMHYSVEECLFPFSGAKATAEWLKNSGLLSRPLVIEPDTAAPAIIAFTGVESVGLLSCLPLPWIVRSVSPRTGRVPAGDRWGASRPPAAQCGLAGSGLPPAVARRKSQADGHPTALHIAPWHVLALRGCLCLWGLQLFTGALRRPAMNRQTAVIIGAGPAGMTAALELERRTGIRPIVIEATDAIGGISRTIRYKGNRMDIGGHRFFSKSDRVMQWWLDLMPVEAAACGLGLVSYPGQRCEAPVAAMAPAQSDLVMLVRPRKSRIYFLRRFFDYPHPAHSRHAQEDGSLQNHSQRHQLHARRPVAHTRGKDAGGLSHQPLRPPTLPHLLQVVHREDLGCVLLPDQRGVGGPTHQGALAERRRSARSQEGVRLQSRSRH
jgi:hypothetical protein